MLCKADNTTETSMTVWYSLILIINLTPNVGITPNANFQSHIIQTNLSKNECMRQAYELKQDPRFFIKNNGRSWRIFRIRMKCLATTGTIAIQLAAIDKYSFF